MTPSLDYIIQSVPWALGGLLVGVLLGRAIVAADAITGAIADPNDDVVTDNDAGHQDRPERGGTMPEPQPRQRWWRRWRRRVTTNGVIVVIFVSFALLTAVQAYVQGERADRQTAETQRLTTCLRDYANDVADALDARSTASGQAQQALDDFLAAVSTATPDEQGRDLVRTALADYLTRRKAAKEAQAANPFPPAPREVCRTAG